LALWLVAAFAIFYNFPDAPAAGTDAVIMLGGASNERLPVADQLQDHVDVHGSTPDLNLKQWVDRFGCRDRGLLNVMLRPECS
jgi:hypothetical protein